MSRTSDCDSAMHPQAMECVPVCVTGRAQFAVHAAAVSDKSRPIHADTTFTSFTRSLGPGIRALPGSRLWLDSCVFRDITVTRPMREFEIQASSIAANDNVELVLVVCPQPYLPDLRFLRNHWRCFMRSRYGTLSGKATAWRRRRHFLLQLVSTTSHTTQWCIVDGSEVQ